MTDAMQIDGLCKRFGGIVVADQVSHKVAAGEVLGLIGPNGAGKTSLFNLISGLVAPDSGSITIGGVPVEGMSMHKRARLGVARTWQNTRLFGSLSLIDNLLVAQRHYPGDDLSDLLSLASFSGDMMRPREQAMGLLERVGLENRATALPTELSYGQQKLVGLARALMNEGTLLLLDEPMAGVEGRTYNRIKQIIGEEVERGKALVVVEHNVGFIRDICNRAIFMFNGRIIASGTVGELIDDPRLTQIYFGGQG